MDQRVNLYLVAGVAMTVGVLLGPRGLGGLVIDALDPRRRRRSTDAASLVDPAGTAARRGQ